ncbi:MAG: hypothetical protein ACOY3F_06425 [Bacillota bacterium]
MSRPRAGDPVSRPACGQAACGRPQVPDGVRGTAEVRPSIVEVVVGPSGLEVYERAGEGAVEALEHRLRALGLVLRVRRRAVCG